MTDLQYTHGPSGRYLFPFILMALILAAGCSAPPVAAPVEGELLPGSGPLRTEGLLLLRAARWTYERDDGSEIAPFIYERQSTDQYQAEWRTIEGDLRESFWRVDPETGNLLLTAVIDHKDNSIARFNPHLPILYPVMQPGEMHEVEVRMVVLTMDASPRVREQGTARRTIIYEGDQEITTPAGRFMSHRLRVEFRANLRLANAVTSSVIYVVPRLGIVAEETEELIRVLGAFDRKDRESLRLLIPPPELHGDGTDP